MSASCCNKTSMSLTSMMPASAFVAPFAAPALQRQSSSQRTPRRSPAAFRRCSRVTPMVMGTPSPGVKVKVGEIVAVQEGKRVAVARVTGVASSGDTVDIAMLKEFVKELYVAGSDDTTYISSKSVRPVRAEYVPSQEGWIVLNQDLEAAKTYFELKPLDLRGSVVVEEAPRKELDPEALKKQGFPKPTKEQAFFGAAFSLPLAALTYAVFASARNTFSANPSGEGLMSGATFRQIVLFTTFSGSVLSLVVGCSLFLYALQYKDESGSADGDA